MSRGMLDNSDWKQYGREIPDLTKLQDMVDHLPLPDFLSLPILCNKSYQSWFPITSICFKEAHGTLWGAHYALAEVIAHDIWYMRKKDPPNKDAATLFGCYYADDATFRLYSAGEHLANGIIMMLEISDEELKQYRREGKRISQQSILGNYLRKEKAGHPVAKAVIRLADSKEWQATMTYRNRWVHEQPPTVKGLGIVYQRRIRWEFSPKEKRYKLPIGGDKPEYSIDDLIQFIEPAMSNFIDTFICAIEFYNYTVKSLIQGWNNVSNIKIQFSKK